MMEPSTPGALGPVSAGVDAAAGGRTPVDPAELNVYLDGPLHLDSGQTLTHILLIENRSDRDVTVETNGNVTAAVVDPASGEEVGGYVGFQIQPLVRFTAGPGQRIRIPLLVGTASRVPRLGYGVPAGLWHLSVPLDLADGRKLDAGPLQLTIRG